MLQDNCLELQKCQCHESKKKKQMSAGCSISKETKKNTTTSVVCASCGVRTLKGWGGGQ